MEGATEVGTTYRGISNRGIGCQDLGEDLCGGVTGIFSIWARDMGNETTHWEVFWRIPTQGGPQADGMASTEGGFWTVAVSPDDGGNG